MGLGYYLVCHRYLPCASWFCFAHVADSWRSVFSPFFYLNDIIKSLILNIHIFRRTTAMPSVHACQLNEKCPVPDATTNVKRSTSICGCGCGSVSSPYDISRCHTQSGLSLLDDAFLLSYCNSLSYQIKQH